MKQIESKAYMDMVYLFWAARPCSFRQCITFHPHTLVHLRLCQHSQGVQVGSVCRMQLKT